MTTSKGRNVMITGVSSGIGLALAKKYLENDLQVYGISRSTPMELMQDKNFFFASIDLAKLSEIPNKLDNFFVNISSLDLVILNAGIIGKFGDMTAVSLQTMKKVMDVNMWSNKCILDYLTNKNILLQQVVAISSGASVSGSRGWNAYGISKAALNMLIKLYSKEYPVTHFCSLAPGVVDTSMQDYLCDLPLSEKYPTLNIMREKRHTEEMPRPDEVAEQLIVSIEKIKNTVESGEYVDIRKM